MSDTALPRDEQDLRREGRWALASGYTTAAAATVIAVTFRIASNELPYELYLGVMGAASIGIAYGLREKAGRPFRALLPQLAQRQQDILDRVTELEKAASAMSDRMASMEQTIEKVPGYAEGFVSGVEMTKRVQEHP